MERFTGFRAVSVAGRVSGWEVGAASTARRVTLAALFCLLSSAVHAQSDRPAQPDRPGQSEPAGKDEPTTRPAPTRSSWSYSLGVHEAYESDVRFNGEQGNGDWHTRFEGALGRQLVFPRGSLDVNGSLGQLLYRRNPDQDRTMYSFGGGVSYDLTRRLHLVATEMMASTYSEDSTVLTTIGTVLPRVETRTNVASGALTYQLSPRMTVDASVTGTTITFPADEFSNGSSLTVRSSFARQVTPTQTIGLSVGNTFSTGTTGDIQGVLATWQMTRGRSLTLMATGGVRPYTLDGVAGHQYAPGGSFGIESAFSRNQTFSASYENAVEQAYGFDRTHKAHRFNANYGYAVGRRLTLEGTASYGLNTYPQIPDYTLDGRTVMASMRYLLGRRFFLGAAYGLWARKETASPVTTTYRTSFSLTYGVPGR
jgi:hypothetical protein